ncbi:MAG: replication factor C small subunit [Candidatus Altiarchaeota archaeon]|nr:replication factor C small subunit [Candidatus Altiarchaeota archaeon]
MADYTQIWTEKYRPNILSEMINQKPIVERLSAFVKAGSIPHMLFAGPPGVGKTTAALCLTKEFFGDNWKQNYLETNASDERGIDVVRNKIKDFARTQPLGGAFKIIFLDEADALTKDAQQALRRTMEKYSKTCRFILSCNYPSKIIEPIQSRTVVFRFRSFENKDIAELVTKIAKGEKLELDKEALDGLVEMAEGDARAAVNLIQSSAAQNSKLNRTKIYEAAARARPEEVKTILDTAIKGNFQESRKMTQDLIVNKGVSADLFLKELHRKILVAELNNKRKAELLNALAEFEFRILEGANEFIQLDALLARISVMGDD